ncbi:MAG: hypothetical protein AAGA46_06885 [Cyanobacteria bacterium P01_F01_bin.13]
MVGKSRIFGSIKLLLDLPKYTSSITLDVVKQLKKPSYNAPSKGTYSSFNFLLYGGTTAFILLVVGAINWAIDPLWYGQGNRITGRNYDFPDERTLKTNLFLNTKDKDYNCLILGSSRSNALRVSAFEGENCFNYSFKSGHIEEFSDYADFVKKQGIQPQKVYVGVDEFNFLEEFNYQRRDVSQLATGSPFEAYLSSGILLFSIKTLLDSAPDLSTYYDNAFEMQVLASTKAYEPSLNESVPGQFVTCDLSKIELYKELREQFPNAEVIAYVPPRSAWKVVSETYKPQFLDCVLQGFHEVAQHYDGFYDFSIPSAITKNPEHTYDGSHFFPGITDEIAAILQGSSPSFGIEVSDMSFEDYTSAYKEAVYEFLKSENALHMVQEDYSERPNNNES